MACIDSPLFVPSLLQAGIPGGKLTMVWQSVDKGSTKQRCLLRHKCGNCDQCIHEIPNLNPKVLVLVSTRGESGMEEVHG